MQIGLELAQDFVDQGAILDHQKVRIENGGIFCPDGFGDALLHLQNLHPRLNESGFKTPNLTRYIPLLDGITRDVIEIIAHDMDKAARDARRNPGTVKANFAMPRFTAHGGRQ